MTGYVSRFLAVAILAIAANPSVAQYEADISAWGTQDARNPPPENSILFIGDSTIRVWESLARDFNDYRIIQRGFGGAEVDDLMEAIDDIILPYDPAAIVVSNRSGKTRNSDAVQEHIDFFERVHSQQRQDRSPIPMLYVSEFPRLTTLSERWPNQDEPRNRLLEEFASSAEHIHYIDTAMRMEDSADAPGGPPDEDLFAIDRHHHNEQGYLYWQQPIRQALEAVIAPNKVYHANDAGPLEGERILFDFGLIPTDSPDVNGNHWNNWHTDTGDSIKAGQSLGNLFTTKGRETGVDLVITGEFDAVNTRTTGLREPDTNLLGEFAIESATSDSFARGQLASSLGVPNAGFMLTGLDPEVAYDFRFFGSLRSSRDRIARFSILGAGDPVVQDLMLATAGAGQNMDRTADIAGVRPDPFGQIFVDLQPIDGRHDGYLSVMELSVPSQGVAGDFDGDGVLTAEDVDRLTMAIRNGPLETRFDLDADSVLSEADLRFWVTKLKQTWLGDANLDGEFNSGDLVKVFGTGYYEDGIAMNSGWAEGDWNGDDEFDSGDLVFAFQDGGYEQGLRPLAVAVPEPAASMAFCCGVGLLLIRRRAVTASTKREIVIDGDRDGIVFFQQIVSVTRYHGLLLPT